MYSCIFLSDETGGKMCGGQILKRSLGSNHFSPISIKPH
jgi:hypothetical protein